MKVFGLGWTLLNGYGEIVRGSRFLLAPSHRIARGHLSGAAGRCIFYNLAQV